MSAFCKHSCKGLCNALEVAEREVSNQLVTYRKFLADCDYPDVQEVLQELVVRMENDLAFLQQKREVLSAKFDVLDNITQSFS